MRTRALQPALSSSNLRRRALRLALVLTLALPGCSNEAPQILSPVLVGAGGSPLPQGARLRTIRVPEFLDGRICKVYLPPGYAPARARYPVLYMHDGQTLWGPSRTDDPTWQLDAILDSLILGGFAPPLIVVGIDNADRVHEYAPFPGPFSAQAGGDGYIRAIRDHLKPAIDRHFATRSDARHTLMAGTSLGGLITVYAGYAYDDVFGCVAAFSGSFWYGERAFFEFASVRKPDLARFYLDAGNDNYTWALRMRDHALQQGFVEGEDLMWVHIPGHEHAPYYWAQRFPDALKFMVGNIDPLPRP